ETGESEVFYDKDYENMDWGRTNLSYQDDESLNVLLDICNSTYAATDEKHDPNHPNINWDKLKKGRGIEVGHIFNFGTKYSEAMNAVVQNKEGQKIAVHMGSYGIGVSRLVGAIIEANHDEVGIIWPESVAPFKVGIVNLRVGDDDCDKASEKLYSELENLGVETLYDDRDERAGAKFSTMDLIGLPYVITIGPRGLKSGLLEIKDRKTGERFDLCKDEIINKLKD
ncbi:MAG: His/Gly/Thr/Pro-type tRNA ligase C-terminal domain-containing protein, partial [Sphingomonadales bacterium]